MAKRETWDIPVEMIRLLRTGEGEFVVKGRRVRFKPSKGQIAKIKEGVGTLRVWKPKK